MNDIVRRKKHGLHLAAIALCSCVFSTAVMANESVQNGDDDTTPEVKLAIESAQAVMKAFMAAFNSRDAEGTAKTLLFPHVRVASGGVVVIPDATSYVAATDMEKFAKTNNWDHSQWDSIELIQADTAKVHFKVVFSRFNPQGVAYVTYNSLYIVQKVGDVWGIRARSSFAP